MHDIAVFSDTACTLGEGPIWHPERQSLLWFDILEHRLYERDGAGERHWQFDRPVSAAGWVNETSLLIATACDLIIFDLATGAETPLVPLEADDRRTRSNDGRADPHHGFWIGTMGVEAEPGAGAIYRYYRGALRRLFEDVTIPNAICFAVDGRTAYFGDTAAGVIQRVALDGDGWPEAAPQPFLRFEPGQGAFDGAVIDADDGLWTAQWGFGRLARFDPSGHLIREIDLPATNVTCPAFGGSDMTTLFATSARVDAPEDEADAGQTFAVAIAAPVAGRTEPRVIP